ncbi:putative remorin [Dioscorea sansibarensis]
MRLSPGSTSDPTPAPRSKADFGFLTGGSTSDDCRDLDMVSSHTSSSSRVRSQDEESLDSEIGMQGFEFQKAGRGVGVLRPPLASPFLKPAPSKWDDAQKWINSPGTNKNGRVGVTVMGKKSGNRPLPQPAKVVLEVMEEGETKRVDLGQGKKNADNSVTEFATVCSRHDSSISIQSDAATSLINPASTARSVCMRDMGTEMTPIASQEPSRTGTPIRSTTPALSPNSSRLSSPLRSVSNEETDRKESSEREVQMKIREEIKVLGTQLGKKNIAAWADREQEEKARSTSFKKNVINEQPQQSVAEIRATAWEEAEKAKYLARFKREEIRIQAWEDHQKAQIDTEMKKIEATVERMKADAHERFLKKQASIRQKAETKLQAAIDKRNQQATKIARQVEYIRKTGRVPSSFACWDWCF